VFADARAVETNAVVEADVCIVGAGAAGITLARELIGSRLRVAVLESGGQGYEVRTQHLYRGPNTGLPYFALDGVRLRYFGGTTNHWGGFCRPFDDADFEPRRGLPHTGWPIKAADLRPFYDRASVICGLPSPDWRPATSAAEMLAPIRLRADRFVNRVVRIVPPAARSFGTRYREELRRASNVTVYLHANAVEIETNESGRAVRAIRVATLSGRRFAVRARVFVLAAGGLETPRLLLASNRQWARGVGNHTGIVGRFFMEHPRFLAAYLAPAGDQPNPRFYSEHQKGREDSQGYLASAKEFQLAEGVLDVQLSLEQVYDVPTDVSDYAGYVTDLVGDVEGWPRVAIPGSPVPIPYPEVLRKAASDPKDTYNAVRGKVDSIAVTTRIEQAPNPDSRVTLIRDRDALGMHRIALDWELSRADKHNLERTLALFGAEIGRAGLGRVKVVHGQDDSGWPSDTAGGWHLIGTTRMSSDPRRGVVDPDGRVHGISNLYLAGSSVFPTAGGATPTFTLVALTLRLAEHLKTVELR
jgi:choline dehydrogenase-like flavoprotein